MRSKKMENKIPTFEELKISPSMLKTVAQCPLKFWQSYITKTLPYVESAQKARGTKLHKFMEDSIDSGVFQYDPDDKSCASARKFFAFVNSKKQKGWKVKTEVCCGVDMDNVPVEYAKANLRCKIDCLMVAPNGHVLILDWKTGKKYEADALQLQVNVMCIYKALRPDHVVTAFCYLDSGDVTRVDSDVGGGVISLTDCIRAKPENVPQMQFLETVMAVRSLYRTMHTHQPEPKKNRFCDWCNVPDCPCHKVLSLD